MEQKFWFAHISDLHFSKDNDKSESILGLLKEDLSQLCVKLPDRTNGPHKIDLLLLTGDIANHGCKCEYRGAEAWLTELQKKNKIDKIAITPGNHDVKRPAPNDNYSRGLHRILRSEQPSDDTLATAVLPNTLEEALSNKEPRKSLLSKFTAFQDFLSRIGAVAASTDVLRPQETELGYESGIHVNLVLVNTALLSIDDNDIGRLRTPVPPLYKEYVSRQWKHPTLLASHHGPSELHRETSEALRAFVQKSGALWCCGHQHADACSRLDGPDGGTNIQRAGTASKAPKLSDPWPLRHTYYLCCLQRETSSSDSYRLTIYPRLYTQNGFRANIHLLEKDKWSITKLFPSPSLGETRKASPSIVHSCVPENRVTSSIRAPEGPISELTPEPDAKHRETATIRARQFLSLKVPVASWDGKRKLWINRENLSGARLHGACMVDRDWSGAHLPYAELKGADLANARLDGADLRHADLSLADLRGAHARGALFQGAFLHCTRFLGTDLRQVAMKDTKLQGAILRGSKLHSANFSGSDVSGMRAEASEGDDPVFDRVSTTTEPASYARAVLPGATYRAAELESVSFKQADLRGTDFRDANLKGANFRFADLEGAVFLRAVLCEATFDDALVKGTVFSQPPHRTQGEVLSISAPKLRVHPAGSTRDVFFSKANATSSPTFGIELASTYDDAHFIVETRKETDYYVLRGLTLTNDLLRQRCLSRNEPFTIEDFFTFARNAATFFSHRCELN